MTASRPQPGDRIAGRYRVLEILGAGGAGEVFKVADEDLRDAVVALKLLHANVVEHPELYERFRAEVLIARGLQHPGIVRVFDLGRTDDGMPFLTMEFVEGETMKSRIERMRSDADHHPSWATVVPEADVLDMLRQLLDAVGYAHGKGVVHRDLKPHNILIAPGNVLKLLDFGTARVVESDLNLTQTGEMIGTPLYMAPEAVRGERMDPRCDIYAIGLIAAELLLGAHPIKAHGALDALVRHLHEPLPPLERERYRVPAWLDPIIRKAAAKDPAERYQSAAEFQAALDRRREGTARVDSPWQSRLLGLVFAICAATIGLVLVRRHEPVALVRPEPSAVPVTAPTAFPQVSSSAAPVPATPPPSAVPSPARPERTVPVLPSLGETGQPTERPLDRASEGPTERLTERPTARPIEHPVQHPTALSTELPTERPTERPPGTPPPTPRLPLPTPAVEPAHELPPSQNASEIFFRLSSEGSPRSDFTLEELGSVRWIATVKRPPALTDGMSTIIPGVVLELRNAGSGRVLVTSHARLLALDAPDGADSTMRVSGALAPFAAAELPEDGRLEAVVRTPNGEEAAARITVRRGD